MKEDNREPLAPEKSFLLFRLDRQTYAIALEQVERVERIVEISPLPNAARGIAGVINYHGRPLQVLDLRVLFHLPLRERILDDVLVLVGAFDKMAAFIADRVDGVATWRNEDIVRPQRGTALGVQGICRHHGELIYICDLHTATTDDWPEPAATERSVAADEQGGGINDAMGERDAGASQPNGGTRAGVGVCNGTLE